MADDPPLTLRERKRFAAMRRIQTVAMDLFEAHGFAQTPVERIAEVAEVSPSSIYRYFGTKERIVVWDEFDARALVGIEAELDQHAPLDAIRQVIEALVMPGLGAEEGRVQRRLRLAFETPSIEAAAVQEAYGMAGLIAALLVERGGLSDLDAKVLAHGFVGALLGGLRHWYDSDFTTPLSALVDRPLALLELGVAEA